jgi:hypothetical protein
MIRKKYVCLGHMEEKWETMSESGRNAMIDECFVYDDLFRKNGAACLLLHVVYFTLYGRKSVLNGVLIVVYA